MKLAIVICFSILMTACSDFKNFQENVVLASQDKVITEDEFTHLAKMVLDSNADWASQLKIGNSSENSSIDAEKLVNQIIILSEKKDIILSKSAISVPKKFMLSGTAQQNKYSVYLLIENSASMDGYVKGTTDFEATIVNLLTRFKSLSEVTDVNYSFINSKVGSTHTVDSIDKLKSEFDNLEPTSFRNQTGSRSSSDIAELIVNAGNIQAKEKAGDEQNEKIVVLVSDFIFSPDDNQNVNDYLSSQSAFIEGAISERIKENTGDYAILIVKLSSVFNGMYYDQADSPHAINKEQRPYYVWFMGKSNSIKPLYSRLNISNLPNFSDEVYFSSEGTTSRSISYRVLTNSLLNNPTASFDFQEAINNNIITNAEVVQKDNGEAVFKIEVAVDFSQSDYNNLDVYLDKARYNTNSSHFEVLSIRPADSEAKKRLSNATHIIEIGYVGKGKIPRTKLKVAFSNVMPDWIENSSTMNDSDISHNDETKKKTFNFITLVKSVDRAFKQDGSEEYFNLLIEP